MKKLILTVIFVLAAASRGIPAQVAPQWMGVHALAPKAMYWSGVCHYNNKIYVFGGYENGAETDTTYIYDIASDAWSQGTDMPTGRYLCTAVEAGGKIYVMGGRQIVASTNPLDVNECYDPAADSWTTKLKMPNAIRGHAACAAGGIIYVLGGNTGAYTDAVSKYDPSANSWSGGAKMPFKAGYGGAVYSTSTNCVYWVGGVKSSSPSASNYLGRVYTFDLSSGTWDAGTAMPDKTAYFGCAADADGSEIYIVGGNFWNDEEYSYPFTQVFNTASKTFGDGMMHPSPWNREYASAVFSGGSLFILGCNGNSLVDSYDTATGEFYEPNSPLNDGAAAAYIVGGVPGAVNGKFYVVEGGFYLPLAGSAYEYDPGSNSWIKRSATNSVPRLYVSGGQWNDKIVIYGGMDESGGVVATAAVYDPAADTFTTYANANPNPTVFETGAVYNDKLYLFGGITDTANPSSLTAGVSILDLVSGAWSTGADLPEAIEQASAAVYNGKIYVFGGLDNIEPDYINSSVYIYTPSSDTFQTGPAQSELTQAYGSAALTYGNYIIVDSGNNLWYNDTLGGLSGGVLGGMQLFEPAANSFRSVIKRPFGKMRQCSAIIGGIYYSTAGEDPDWPVSRLDIAAFGPVECTLTCSASASPSSGQAPLAVNFVGGATASFCSGSPVYAWNFGDGGTSNQKSPVHTYEAFGTYNWSLTVTIEDKSCVKYGTVTVSAPSVVYQSHGPFTEITGNGDQYFDKGEKWSVAVTVTNEGNVQATNATCELSGNGITVCDGSGVYGTIPPGGTSTCSYDFFISWAFYPCGDTVNFGLVNKSCLELTPAGNDETGLFSIQVGQVSQGVPADLVVQPPSADSHVYQFSSGTNYGTATTMSVQARTAQCKRALVRFDVPSIPAGSTINSATLELYATAASGGAVLNVHRITSEWSETGVTYADQPSFASAADASIGSGGTAGWKVWDVASVVRDWAEGISPNYGLMVKFNVETGLTAINITFATREHATENYRPILRINYTPPTVANCDYTGAGTCAAACSPPSPPVIDSVTEEDPCVQDGIRVSYTSGTPATRHDLYVDGALALAMYSSGSVYDPGNTSSHSYAVRAVNGYSDCFTDSPPAIHSDSVCSDLGEAAPGDTYENAQAWSEDKNVQSWPALTGASGYKVFRGNAEDLQSLIGPDDDSCIRYWDSGTSVDLSADDPSLEPGALFWYLVAGTNGLGDGPAGNATAGPRTVNAPGNCE